MPANTSVNRSAILALSGAALVITICFFGYSQWWSPPTLKKDSHQLHRSNAVRQRRRRWRPGFHPRTLDYDPVDRALQHLKEHEEAGQGYGYYTNAFYTRGLDATVPPLTLLPSQFDRVYEQINTLHHDLSNEVQAQIRVHVQALFLVQFLKTEFPEGYILGDDHSRIAPALQPCVDPDILAQFTRIFDRGEADLPTDMLFSDENVVDEDASVADGRQDTNPAQDLARQLRDNSSLSSHHDTGNDQNVLDLLYRIGEEQAKVASYKHRGVECNGCGMHPIQGIRYHCANCYDYDLCEQCEAQQFHAKTHVFYKIRIPAPTRGQVKSVQPIWYPGRPDDCPTLMPADLRHSLLNMTNLDRQELDALYDQFTCIAGQSSDAEKEEYDIEVGISFSNFSRYFTTTTSDRPPVPNLIFDRIFAFYDKDSDGMISFEEFACGMAALAYDTTRASRVRRLFQAFDLDEDGFVSRKDFLYMLRAHYALNTELINETVLAREDDVLPEEELDQTVRGSNPISAPFSGGGYVSHASRHGEGKYLDMNGDYVFNREGSDILEEDSSIKGARSDAIRRGIGKGSEQQNATRRPKDDPVIHVVEDDAQNGNLSGPVEQDGRDALHERWLRRQFYTDEEEGMTVPEGYTNLGSTEDEAEVNGWLLPQESPTLHGQSETSSGGLSSGMPRGKKQGGFEFGVQERDVGVEVMYEAIQEGFNDFLDHFFKKVEDQGIEAQASRKLRERWVKQIIAYGAKVDEREQSIMKAIHAADALRTEELLNGTVNDGGAQLTNKLPDDPTLPQFRPNADDVVHSSSSDDVEPSEEELKTWYQHMLIDIEAATRGGYGRLSFEEFKQKLRDDNNEAVDVNDQNEYWETKADLGRFSFLSSWLEMASF